MRVSSLSRLAVTVMLVGMAACQSASTARTVPTPVAQAPAPAVTSILARNFGAYDAGVYALAEGGKAIWLTTVPAGGTRSIPVAAQHLQATGLVLRVQALGSERTWTSAATLIDGETTGVLDLEVDRAGNPMGTLLRLVPTTVYHSALR